MTILIYILITILSIDIILHVLKIISAYQYSNKLNKIKRENTDNYNKILEQVSALKLDKNAVEYYEHFNKRK